MKTMDLKRSATMLEMIMSVCTVLGVVVTAYISLTVTQARQDERIKQVEVNYRDINNELREITKEIREINNKQTEIMLELKDKQDRSK
jgi:peptidoglycan hydrolase CwlO-like protein